MVRTSQRRSLVYNSRADRRELAKQFEEIHETIGKVGYLLIGLHAAAALTHHYFCRDNTLVRMLPSRSAKSPS